MSHFKLRKWIYLLLTLQNYRSSIEISCSKWIHFSIYGIWGSCFLIRQISHTCKQVSKNPHYIFFNSRKKNTPFKKCGGSSWWTWHMKNASCISTFQIKWVLEYNKGWLNCDFHMDYAEDNFDFCVKFSFRDLVELANTIYCNPSTMMDRLPVLTMPIGQKKVTNKISINVSSLRIYCNED